MNSELLRSISDCSDEIEKIKKWIDKNPMDTLVKYLVSYAVVKSSGTIEIVFKSILYVFLADGCKKETETFIEKNVLDISCNPGTRNIKNLLDRIDTEKSVKFEELTKGTVEKEDLNSLVKLRNDIAHGRDISISINTVKRFYESGIGILKVLDSLFMD